MKANAKFDRDMITKGLPLPKKLNMIDLSTQKKWKWIQEYDLKFIDKRADFYQLISELSAINYFNKEEVFPSLKTLINRIDAKEFEIFVLDLYNDIKSGGNKRSGWFISDKGIVLKIFVWLINYLETPNRYTILSKLADKCFTKIPRVGPTSRKVGDHILKILTEDKTIESLGVLINLKSRAKYPIFREELDKAIGRAISYSKLDLNEVEDYFISDFGLKDGQLVSYFGDFRSVITVERYDKVNLSWFKPDGKTQKTVPAKVKSDFTSELKLWKAKQKDIKKDLSGQKQRLERFWQKNKSWSFENWEKHVLNHQLLCFISRRLIWQFEQGMNVITAIWEAGQLIDINNKIVTDLEDSTVSLWHPVNASITEVENWRTYLLEKEIKQPFKQAFREIYRVTDAEISTVTFSNRFLNHVLQHHKFTAIAKQRTWIYASVYSYINPYIDFQAYKIRAMLDLESEYDFAVIGRVHFRDLDANIALEVEAIPVIIFSEIMRDVDLFVGVCSIGMQDRLEQPHNQHRNYWEIYQSSELLEIAKTRRRVLKNMLPKLKISDQCELTDRFLIVKGKIKTYKIHLGSGNILMEPNNQYLCIVPSRNKKGPADSIFLPFDDDLIFSIILSKAFLLAADDQITDPVILMQLK